MPEFTVQKVLSAPVKAVWGKISDFGNVHIFHPMVEKSVLTGDKECGVGAKRTCSFYGGKGHVDEVVTEYTEGRSMTVELVGGSMPVKTIVVRFDLAEEKPGRTVLSLDVSFEMKYGLFGKVMGPILMKPMMKKMMGDILKSLEQHLVTGKNIGRNGRLEAATAK